MLRTLTICCLISGMTSSASADLKMSPIFGDSMVVQRDQPIHVWGWTAANTDVSVQLARHTATAKSDANGRFDAMLDGLPAGGPHELTIAADETRTFSDVLVGEVWLCSGQSNMAWTVAASDDQDLELLTANHPQIRLISVPQVASQTPRNDFNGQWEACTAESARQFSAVGYFFGRRLLQTAKAAATTLQAATRRVAGQRAFAQQKAAATTLQAAARMVAGRSALKTAVAAATTLQAGWRGAATGG